MGRGKVQGCTWAGGCDERRGGFKGGGGEVGCGSEERR